jgi:hypothetical protein
MFLNKNMHNLNDCLNYNPDCLWAENRLAFKKPQKKETAEGLKKIEKEKAKEIKRAREIRAELYKKELIELETSIKNVDDIVSMVKEISKKFSKKNRRNVEASIMGGFKALDSSVIKQLFKAGKLKIEFYKGILTLKNKKENIHATINLFETSPYLSRLKLFDKKRQEALTTHKNGRAEMANAVSGNKNLDKFVRPKYKKFLKKKDKTYIVDFKQKGRINRLAERKVSLLHIFNMSGLNAYVEIEIKGKTSGGRNNNCIAYYHPAQKKFIIKHQLRRAKIFHGNKITVREYKPLVEKPKKAPVPAAKKPETLEKKPKVPELTKAEFREERRYNRDASLWTEYARHIFENKRFAVPKYLQDDVDFKKNWKRIDSILEAELSRPPFNLTTAVSRREYIQDTIQDYYNSRLYAEDFFKYKLKGKPLYKGGYEKLLKDFATLEDKDLKGTITDEELDQLVKIETIIVGIARVFDALRRLTLHKKNPESNTDAFRPKLVGINEMNDKEKEEAKKIPSGNFHSLESLLHKNEAGPKKIALGASDAKIDQLKNNIKSAASDIPDFSIDKYLQGPDAKDGLKLLFMAYGFDELVKRGCIKKYDQERYILVKVPKQGWLAALMMMRKEKPELWETDKKSFNKWERVRESLNKGVKARRYIAKIFSPLKTGEIEQELSWWEKFCHIEWNKKKEISMSYLGKATLNPSEYEKFMAEARGYHDMMEKTSKRVEGTSIYEPQGPEVIKLSNRYLEYGLMAALMQATNKTLPKVIEGIVKQFKIEGKVNLKKPYKNNKIENLKAIHEAVMVKNLNRNMLTEAHIKFIRLGHIMGRYIETSKNWSESMQQMLSNKPLYRKIQMKALKQGCPVHKLKEVAERVHLAIFGYSEGMKPGHVRAGGGALNVDLGRWAGQSWNFSFSVIGTDGKPIPAAAIGSTVRAGKKVKIRWSVGASIGFAGAKATLEFPITDEWDMYLGAGAGISWKGGVGGGAAAGIGVKWNQKRAEKLKIKAAIAERGIENIQKALNTGNIDKAANLILKNETFGAYMKHLKEKLSLPNEVICDIYKKAENDWINKAREGVEVPWVTGAGLGVVAGGSKTSAGFSIYLYVTFKIPGSEVIYVMRHEHPKFSERVQRSIANDELKRQLKKEGQKNTVISKYILNGKSGMFHFDSQLGRSHVSRPRNMREAKESIAVREKEQSADLSFKSSFDAIKQTFLNLDISVEKVKDPKNPKGNLIALTPMQIEETNLEMLIDPELASKGLILDKANNRILLAASDAKRLYVTRTRYRYPYRRKGALNIDVIAFRTNPNRSNIAIREESPQYIYKYSGEKYTMVKGQARSGLDETQSNTITLEQYKRRKQGFETFVDHKFEYSILEGRDLTRKMSEAVGIHEAPKIRPEKLKLKTFADEWFDTNKEVFNKRVGSISSIEQENSYKKDLFGALKEQFKTFAKSEGISLEAGFSLNDQELNLIYNYLLNESFTDLRKNGNDRLITDRLEKRNELFRKFITDRIKKFKKDFPEKWDSIKQIDPSITPESIANYLVLCMPQNASQLKKFDSGRALQIGENIKYAAYTWKARELESMPSSYGVDNPKEFSDIFKILSPTKLKVNSTNTQERAAARLVLELMSPLHNETLNTLDGKEKFLKSELSLLVMSIYDPDMEVSPLIQVLGKSNYMGMIEIYRGLKNRSKNPEQFKNALSRNSNAFDAFEELVSGIRNAQIEGDKSYIYKDKYVFHLEDTGMYAGPYLKCGNGTLAIRQKISISTMDKKTQKWYAPDKKGYNIITQYKSKKAFKEITLGWTQGFDFKTPKSKERKGEMPDENIVPPRKGGDTASESTAGGV